ncbi:hypothetical protein BDY21DRAFT_360878 [Lineolata rhizophorae]|uniref:Uncharacterized protein n=1 Tax=Lineolata rhizophorae TaxID=578093 RepID=A0A6A6PA78_9PEZI|nr:hypothetical protein BDY21DRAFT_360878 [Lineolata rhizophorae]
MVVRVSRITLSRLGLYWAIPLTSHTTTKCKPGPVGAAASEPQGQGWLPWPSLQRRRSQRSGSWKQPHRRSQNHSVIGASEVRPTRELAARVLKQWCLTATVCCGRWVLRPRRRPERLGAGGPYPHQQSSPPRGGCFNPLVRFPTRRIESTIGPERNGKNSVPPQRLERTTFDRRSAAISVTGSKACRPLSTSDFAASVSRSRS